MKNTSSYISIANLCTHYQIEISFFNALEEVGLLEITVIEQIPCLHQDYIGDLEKIIGFHHHLNINIEGIDAIFNLLNKIENLQQELQSTKNRLAVYKR
jgi:hypothetical protein